MRFQQASGFQPPFGASGRGQPTMTIQALAFPAAEHIARFARNGEI